MRHKAADTDLSGILTEDIEEDVKDAAEIEKVRAAAALLECA